MNAPASHQDRARESYGRPLTVFMAPKGTDCQSCCYLEFGFEGLLDYLAT